MTASALWTAVVASYEDEGLKSLTNPRNKGAASIDTTYGENAAQDVIDLWPIYAQCSYDASDSMHVAVAKQGVIALLYRRGGSSAKIEKVKWDEVFGPDGMLFRLRRNNARAHAQPKSNSGTAQAPETHPTGRRVRPWSSRESLPTGVPSNRTLE